jgi:hypothetical protein
MLIMLISAIARGNAAATRDVPTKPKREEFVSGMAQRGSFAATRDVPTKPKS